MNPRVLPFFTPRSLIQNMCTQEPRDLLTLYGQAATAVTRLVSHAAWPNFRNSRQRPNLSSPQTNPPFSSQMQFFHSRVPLTGYAPPPQKKTFIFRNFASTVQTCRVPAGDIVQRLVGQWETFHCGPKLCQKGR